MYRIGEGYDVHRLVAGRDLILGGLKIDYEMGLLGHSDRCLSSCYHGFIAWNYGTWRYRKVFPRY